MWGVLRYVQDPDEPDPGADDAPDRDSEPLYDPEPEPLYDPESASEA
jgi:hypothetical protein